MLHDFFSWLQYDLGKSSEDGLSWSQALNGSQNIWNLFENHQRSQAPNWKPSTETVKQLRLAEASGDPVKMFGAAFDYMRAYVRDVEAPKLAAELRNQEREKEKKAATVASTKAGDAARANADRPTAVSGGAPVNSNRTILDNPNATLADRKRAFEAEYGIPFPG